MKATAAKDLVIGKIYIDIDECSMEPALFKYEGTKKGRAYFTFIGGSKSYGCKAGDSVDFTINGPTWYEYKAPSEIEQYLPKTN